MFGITGLSFPPRNSFLRAREFFFFWEEETKELCYDVADRLQNLFSKPPLYFYLIRDDCQV